MLVKKKTKTRADAAISLVISKVVYSHTTLEEKKEQTFVGYVDFGNPE